MNYNRNGGLTLVPMPGFAEMAFQLKDTIEGRNHREKDPPTEVDIAIPDFGLRSNGEPFVRLAKDHIGGHDCVVLTSGPGTYQMLVQLLLVLGYLAGRRAGRITVVSSYFPLSRSDKDEGSLELALPRLIVDLMQSAADGRLDRIIAVDLHSPQVVMAGKLGRITEVSMARRVLKRALDDAIEAGWRGKICILLPDDGAQKRYANVIKQVAQETGEVLPVVIGQKRRTDSRNSELLGLSGDISALRGALVIGLDDEIATGKTNGDTAAAVKDSFNALAYWAAASHGVLCADAAELFQRNDWPIDRTYVTGTIPPENRAELAPLLQSGKLVVVSLVKDLAQVLYYHHWDRSIREMR